MSEDDFKFLLLFVKPEDIIYGWLRDEFVPEPECGEKL